MSLEILKTKLKPIKTPRSYYPSSVHVDKIYRTKANRAWCKEKGIRISGPPDRRPPNSVSRATKKQALDDERFRNTNDRKIWSSKKAL